MSNETVTTQDYVRAAIAGNALKAQEIFNQLMAPKVSDAIDQKRTEVARDYFGQQEPEVVVDTLPAPELEDTAAVQVAQSNNDEEVEEPASDAQDQEQEEESHENA